MKVGNNPSTALLCFSSDQMKFFFFSEYGFTGNDALFSPYPQLLKTVVLIFSSNCQLLCQSRLVIYFYSCFNIQINRV